MEQQVRIYTPAELEQLLDRCAEPMVGHHPCVGLLVSMSMMTNMVFLIKDVKEDPDWTDVVMPIILKQILAGTAQVLTRGVKVGKPPKASVN